MPAHLSTLCIVHKKKVKAMNHITFNYAGVYPSIYDAVCPAFLVTESERGTTSCITFNYAFVYVGICDTQQSSVTVH